MENYSFFFLMFLNVFANFFTVNYLFKEQYYEIKVDNFLFNVIISFTIYYQTIYFFRTF